MTLRSIVIGTRGSALAQWQTDHVLSLLKGIEPSLQAEIRIIKTEGDKDQVRALADMGGLGVFTKAIEDALLAGEIDLAVHSLKDLPTDIAESLVVAAIPKREDPRDCLVSGEGKSLDKLPEGARVGTSSARRTAQILALRPDVQIIPLRGNIDTRLRKAHSNEYDAVVLAAAGITRLGRADEITEYLPLDAVLPDPGQGALAVEIRKDDADLGEILSRIDDPQTHAAVTAERGFLRALGGGCRMPIGACGHVDGAKLWLQGMIASVDGKHSVRGDAEGPIENADEIGTRLAVELLAAGGASILDASPLKGKRVLITRARAQARTLADKIQALGGTAVEFPVIDVSPLENPDQLDRALKRATQFDWIVFTSANGVRAVADRLRALNLPDSNLRSRKLAAIGPATAHALESIGLHVDFMPTKFLGEQIALELPVQPGDSALLLRADIASDVLAQGLQARGVNVEDVDAYHTVKPAVTRLPDSIDAITFTSSSTVQNLVEMLDGKRNVMSDAAIFCIGPVTAQTARELGLRVDAVAAEHTIAGLLAAILKFYQKEHADA